MRQAPLALQSRGGMDTTGLGPACLLAKQESARSGPDHIWRCWQAAFVAVSACLHSGSEPGDSSTQALVATLRKRLSLAYDTVPPNVRMVQVCTTFGCIMK